MTDAQATRRFRELLADQKAGLWSLRMPLHAGLRVRVVAFATDRRRGSWRWRKEVYEGIKADAREVVDARGLMCDELRPGVFAQWSDPREIGR